MKQVSVNCICHPASVPIQAGDDSRCDPMQLSHVTSLSAATDRQLRNQFGLDAITFERFSYRSASMFDLAAASPAVGQRTSLRQHHRCHPEIAEYCNDMFYKEAGRY